MNIVAVGCVVANAWYPGNYDTRLVLSSCYLDSKLFELERLISIWREAIKPNNGGIKNQLMHDTYNLVI